MREETDMELCSCAAVYSLYKHSWDSRACQVQRQEEVNRKVFALEDLQSSGKQTHEDLIPCVSAVAKVSQGLAQEKAAS